MAHNAFIQLSGSKGIRRLIRFRGLKYPVLVKPIVYGNPVLSAQALYFLEQMESVAHVRHEEEPSPSELEYVLDNYLFEFAKRHPETRITSRTTEGTFWEDDSSRSE